MFAIFPYLGIYKINQNLRTDGHCRPESTPQRSEEVTYGRVHSRTFCSPAESYDHIFKLPLKLSPLINLISVHSCNRRDYNYLRTRARP
eukprot:SAG31_NODE_25060_length_468_cov_8.899729_2_plen_88_part_01